MSDHHNNEPKNYPLATPQVARMMGLEGSETDSHNAPVPHLPVVFVEGGAEEAPQHVGPEHVKPHAVNFLPTKIETAYKKAVEGDEQIPQASGIVKVIRSIAPYLLVFAIGIFLYFFFFTKVDFGSMFKVNTSTKTVQDTALLNLQKQNIAEFNTWIKSYYYDISEANVIDPNTDNSGNGLTNFQKFLLNLNPKSYDTLGLGMADSEALAKGINPLSGQPLNDSQKQIVQKYFDMEVIMNKLAINKKNGIAGTGVVIGSSIFGASPALAREISPRDPVLTTNNDAELNAANANNLDINTNVPGKLQIPSMKLDVPLIFSKSTENFDKDLLNGVIHYPGTALPGQIGTAYISGHSSNYAWVKSDYNHVFTHLDQLGKNQSFNIVVTLNSEKKATLHYVVVDIEEYTATDQAQFASNGKSVVALSTCWPVGSTAKRLVVFGELTQVEQ